MFKKIILALGVLFAFTITQAQTANSSISFKKDSNGLFTITIKDSQGIKEFSLEAPDKFPYGGGLSGCPTSFKIDNASFADPDDFTPAMTGTITDCKGNITNLQVNAPVNGVTSGKITNNEPEESATATETVTTPSKQTESPKPTKVEEASTLPSTIQYPVSELGGCASETDCKLYCDDPANANQCVAFAKKHSLLPREDLERAEKFLTIGKGPGGCNSQKSCEAYCNDVSRIDECVAFAEENGFISEKELKEAKKMQSILKSGGIMPGGCTNRNSCEIYCNDPNNMEECLAFAEKSGLIEEGELGQAKKFIEFMKRGETPGGCRSKEQCENYCNGGDHLEECIAFAEKAGMVSKEEAELFKKTGGKGPGGCKGKEQCEAYCQTNQKECFNWAQQNGVMKEEDLKRMQEGMQQFQQNLEQMPPEMVECLKNAVGEDVLNKIKIGEPVFSRDLGEKMQSCVNNFQNEIRQKFGGEGFGLPGEGPEGTHENGQFPTEFSGPGGCKSPEECISYCQTNPIECSNFQGPQRGMPPTEPFSGPTYGQDFGLKCDPGWNVETDGQGRKYCAITQEKCTEMHPGTVLSTDNVGRKVCGASEQRQLEIPEQYQQQYEEQYRQQYDEQRRSLEQQYQQPSTYPTNPTSPAPSYPTSPEDYCKQYPEKCAYPQPLPVQEIPPTVQPAITPEQEIRQEPAPAPTSSQYPTLEGFLLGLAARLLLPIE